MPEIKFPEPSIWETFDLETKDIDPPRLTLKLRPFFEGEKVLLKMIIGLTDMSDPAELFGASDTIVPIIMSRVIGWDLTRGGNPIPCIKAEKETCLRRLIWENMKESPEASVEVDTCDPGEEEPEKPPRVVYLWLKLWKLLWAKGTALKN